MQLSSLACGSFSQASQGKKGSYYHQVSPSYRIQQLEKELQRERALVTTYHDDWESLQEEVSQLTRHNVLLERQLELLQGRFTKLQNDYNVSKFAWQECHRSSSINFLPPVQYDLVEDKRSAGDYQLLQCIGRGSFSCVYKACRSTCTSAVNSSEENQSDLVAIKCCTKSRLDSMDKIQRLDMEVQVLKLAHPNKIHFLEVLHGREAVYLVMEHAWANVRTVFTGKQHQGLNFDQRQADTREVLRGVLSALDFLHLHHIAHLDVKPENIVLVPPFALRLDVNSSSDGQADDGSANVGAKQSSNASTNLVNEESKITSGNASRTDLEIKAENVRLCDFGFSHFCNNSGSVVVSCGNTCGSLGGVEKSKLDVSSFENECSAAFIIGTPGFYAPEMILPRMGRCSDTCEKSDPRNQFCFNGPSADMWSVGATLLDLTIGIREEWMSFYAAAKTDRAKFEEGLFWCLQEMTPEYFHEDADLCNLVTEGLLVHSNDRFTARQVLAHPWIARQDHWQTG